MLGFYGNGSPSRPLSRPDPFAHRLQHRLPRYNDLRALYLFPTLRVVPNIGEENTARFLDQKKSGAARETAQISNVWKVADQSASIE